VNDSKDYNYNSLVLAMERDFELGKKDIFAFEFPVYAELEFSLFLHKREFEPHLDRITSYL
jgi:hypothetical protein